MLLKRVPLGYHLDVVGPDASFIASYEEGIPRRHVIAKARSPEVVIALRLEKLRNLVAGGSKAANLHHQVVMGLAASPGTAVLPKCS